MRHVLLAATEQHNKIFSAEIIILKNKLKIFPFHTQVKFCLSRILGRN